MRVLGSGLAVLVLNACTMVVQQSEAPPDVPAPSSACSANPTSTLDAGDASSCTPPSSVCADAHWLAYFDDGRCVSGTCTFTTKYRYCSCGCFTGFCGRGYTGTAVARPPRC